MGSELFTRYVRLLMVVGGLILWGGAQTVFASSIHIATLGAAADHSEHQIVRAYYNDPSMIRLIAERHDLSETEWNQDEQYLLIETSPDERGRLTNAGFELVVDDALTAELYKEAAAFMPRARSRSAIPQYACYRTVEETLATGEQIANTYPHLAEWIDIGDTWQKQNGSGGYDMMVLRLTNEANGGEKPKAWYMSAVHAREYATAELNTRLAEYLVNNYGTDPEVTWLLDHHEVHLLLQANPDGRKVAETGKLYRKNGNGDACGGTDTFSSSSWHGGIDLNRNYSFNWNSCDGSMYCSSNDACSATYRGSQPASEPETEAIENYVRAIFPDQRDTGYTAAAPDDAMGIFLDIHAYGEVILYPWSNGQYETANSGGFQALARKLGGFNGYRPQRGDELYRTDGSSKDFGYGELGIASMVIELGATFFQDCTTFEDEIFPENLEMLLYGVKASRAPYMLPFGPNTDDVTVSASVVTAGDIVTISATIDDTLYNHENGEQSVQNIAQVEYYIDTLPWEAGAVAHRMSAADGNFDSNVEQATAMIDTAGLSSGQHLIYVRGMDTDGNWGAVTAQFIEISVNNSIPTITATPTVAVTPTATVTPTPEPISDEPYTVFNDEFEAETTWIVNPNSDDSATTGQWQIGAPEGTAYQGVKQSDHAYSGRNALITGVKAGNSIGTFDIDGGVTTVRSAAIDLPAGNQYTLGFAYYLAHTYNSSAADYLRISIVTDNTIEMLFEEVGDRRDDDGVWEFMTTSLDMYAGKTVYLLISAADGANPSIVEAGIDNIQIVANGEPRPMTSRRRTATPRKTTSNRSPDWACCEDLE